MFSTTTDCFSVVPSSWAISRPRMSDVPPAANGTTSVMALEPGQSSAAWTGPPATAARARTADMRRNRGNAFKLVS
ncbi:hypothetical protein D3C72_2025540 [compost metagenome]